MVRNEGVTFGVAAKAHGVFHGEVSAACAYAGVKPHGYSPGTGGRPPAPRVTQAVALVASGKTIEAAAAETGCSPTAIYNRFRRLAATISANAAE